MNTTINDQHKLARQWQRIAATNRALATQFRQASTKPWLEAAERHDRMADHAEAQANTLSNRQEG